MKTTTETTDSSFTALTLKEQLDFLLSPLGQTARELIATVFPQWGYGCGTHHIVGIRRSSAWTEIALASNEDESERYTIELRHWLDGFAGVVTHARYPKNNELLVTHWACLPTGTVMLSQISEDLVAA